jgi:hypothetical protein
VFPLPRFGRRRALLVGLTFPNAFAVTHGERRLGLVVIDSCYQVSGFLESCPAKRSRGGHRGIHVGRRRPKTAASFAEAGSRIGP